VSKVFPDGTTAVREVSMTIGEGEFFTLLGPSGCGKTTILRMIAGFVRPTSGQIAIGGRDVTYVPPNRRDTAMVFQNYALFPHLTVFENVAFGLRVRHVGPQEVGARVREALSQVRLTEMERRRIEQLSGGQQQRVALARALVVRPSLLLLDEPLSNLDAKLREETRSEIRLLQRRAGITAIYVTHDQAEAMAMSDRIAVLNQGEVHQIGSPEDIYHRPATSFVAAFIGKSTLLRGTLTHVDGHAGQVRLEGGASFRVDLRSGSGASLEPGDAVTLSIRPEGFRAAPAGSSENVLAGSVLNTEFAGSHTEYQLAVGDLRVIAWLDGQDHASRVGDTLRITAPPECIYLLA
jgi:iron(III) transport system ATP-binding protein